MKALFSNRSEAGRRLAEKLLLYAEWRNVLVLALPRGGAPVAEAISERLRVPLDVFCVRKLRAPENPEIAMGAVASGGTRILNKDVIHSLKVPVAVLDAVTAREEQELFRTERIYRDHRQFSDVLGKAIILVDDGAATGATMCAAIRALRREHAGFIVAVAPVMSREARDQLLHYADDATWLEVPEDFQSVGQWYEDFTPITESEVREIVRRNNAATAS